METIALIFSILFGLCLGSYATALSYRVPRGISMVRKSRSACPACDHNLSVMDLVPVFSWLFLKGRCRYCRAPIGWRYPLIEFSTAALCVAFFYAFGMTTAGFAAFLAVPVLVAMIDIDLQYKILPDSLNLALAAAGVLVQAFTPYTDWLDVAGGVLLYGLGSWGLRFVMMKLVKREPMGLGDVKFFAAAGVWLGMDAQKLAIFLLLSGVLGVLLGIFWKARMKDPEFPFGPALIASFILVLLSYSDRF